MSVRVQKSKRTKYINPNYIWNPTTYNYKYIEYFLSSNIDILMIKWDEIINGLANVMSTVSSNFHKKSKI